MKKRSIVLAAAAAFFLFLHAGDLPCMAAQADASATAQAEAQEKANEESRVPEPAEYAHTTRCQAADGKIYISGANQGGISDAAYYDGYFYLFRLRAWEDGIGERTDYVQRVAKAASYEFSLAADRQDTDLLYDAFAVAVFDGEKYRAVGNTAYITNPEALAENTEAYPMAQNKKGLLVEPTDTMVKDALELGVNHVVVNIPVQALFGEGIDYEYGGKTWHFSKTVVEDYDKKIRRMSEKSMLVTAILLNGYSDGTPQLYLPGVKKRSDAVYYGFNTSTKDGYETVRALASFLADRYGTRKSAYGKVSNWVIGNEINNQYWNFCGNMDFDRYIREYERSFRVFYAAIKSANKNDRVFFSTDYNWNHISNDGPYTYTAKSVVDAFAERVRAGGDLDWGLAYHPYPTPMTDPVFWDDGAQGSVESADSPIVNLINIDVLTDHMEEAALKSPTGSVRHIILDEQGFTSVCGGVEDQKKQAAAIAYAYYIVDSNPYIDAYIMSRQVDAPTEAAGGLYFGLWKCDMSDALAITPTMQKLSWQVYKYIDVRNRTLEISAFAKEVIGIDRWSDVIKNFKWKSME